MSQPDDRLRLHAIEHHSLIYGPGVRFIIWVQGCTLACKGCWNKETWPEDDGSWKDLDWIMGQIRSSAPLEGITLLGGEPLQQTPAVLNLIKKVKEEGMSVFLYTGYEKHEFDEAMTACYDLSDIVVTGRYVASSRNTSLRWRGSTNQEVNFPTERYRGMEFEDGTDVEISIDHDTGLVTVLGYPDPPLLAEIRQVLGVPLSRKDLL